MAGAGDYAERLLIARTAAQVAAQQLALIIYAVNVVELEKSQ